MDEKLIKSLLDNCLSKEIELDSIGEIAIKMNGQLKESINIKLKMNLKLNLAQILLEHLQVHYVLFIALRHHLYFLLRRVLKLLCNCPNLVDIDRLLLLIYFTFSCV